MNIAPDEDLHERRRELADEYGEDCIEVYRIDQELAERRKLVQAVFGPKRTK